MTDLFGGGARADSAKAKSGLARRKANVSPAPRICAFCGAAASFGRGDARRYSEIVWACLEHRNRL